MTEWLSNQWSALTLTRFLIAAGLFLASILINFVAIAIVLVTLPANYFSSHYERDFKPSSSWLARWGAVIAKNLVGVILLLIGVAMLILPGQGLLTILIGLIMLDIPGKRPLEARIIKRPAVRAAIDNLRLRYGKPPLELD